MNYTGHKLKAGKIVMGFKEEYELNKERAIYDVDTCGSDIAIKIFNEKLFDQKSIEKWGVFYQDRDSIAAKTFVATMEKLLMQHDYQAKPMAMFPVNGNNIDIWIEEIKDKLLRKGSTNV